MTGVLILLVGALGAGPSGLAQSGPAADATRRAGSAAGEPGRRTWVADKAHSSIQFRASHWGIVDIVGWFEDFDVAVRAAKGDLSDAVIDARVRLDSIRMPNPEMAANARDLLFDAARHPEAEFRSTAIESLSEKRYAVRGRFTMKGVTREVRWEAAFNGYGEPPGGSPGYTVKGTLDRIAFGLGGMESLPGGRPILGRTVQVICNLRLTEILD